MEELNYKFADALTQCDLEIIRIKAQMRHELFGSPEYKLLSKKLDDILEQKRQLAGLYKVAADGRRLTRKRKCDILQILS